MALVGETLFFVGFDSAHGYELWRTDGTEAGTVLVKDTRPGSAPGIEPVTGTTLTAVGDKLFFVANDGVHWRELWVSDGSAAGTHMVKEILPGNDENAGYPGGLTNVDGGLVFRAWAGQNAYEMWTSDGTDAGTRRLQDLPGGGFTRLGRRLLFSGTTEAEGSELWAMPLPSIGPLDFHTVEPCRVLDTRDVEGSNGGRGLLSGATRVVEVAGHCGVPVTGRQVSINVTVTGATMAGHLRVFDRRDPRPLASSINFSVGQTRANSAVIGMDELGRLAIYSGQPSGMVHVIVDVNGYFQ
jgi:ELWxxDGT repeat protein